MRLFFATDLHGSENCFRKFTHAARVYGADVLVLGGDLTGKAVIPIVKGAGGRWECQWEGTRHYLTTETDMIDMEKRIRVKGCYPHRCDVEEHAELLRSRAAQDELFQRLSRQTFRGWLELGEERFTPAGVKCYVILGNDDQDHLADCFQGLAAMQYVEDRTVAIGDGYYLYGMGYSNPTPWNTPRELPEEVLAERMQRGLALHQVNHRRLIFNVHCPPAASTLDLAQTSDGRGAPAGEKAIGSTAVRSTIERYQPLVSLHGHVHESPGAVRIGSTLAINPGSDYAQGVLRGAIVTLEGSQVVNHQLLVG